MVFSNNLLMGAAAAAASGDSVYVPKGAIWTNGTDEYLTRTPSSTGTPKVQTFSFWAKINEFGSGAGGSTIAAWADASNHSYIDFNGGGAGALRVATQVSGGNKLDLQTSVVFRDPTAWYHWCVIWDFTNAVSGERGQIYRNGVRVSSFGTETYPATSDVPQWATSGTAETIGLINTAYANMYFSEFIRLDGYAGTPSDFAQYNSNGVWVPKDPTDFVSTNKGTNGFWLDFADSSDLGNDVSGNNNDFTLNNIDSSNATADRPADEAQDTGNFSTFNPLIPQSAFAYSEGNLKTVGTTSASHKSTLTTIAVTGGKWYYEHTVTALSGAPAEGYYVGVQPASGAGSLTEHLGDNADSFAYTDTGDKVNNNTFATYGDTFTTSDVIGVALDLENGKIFFSKNGTWQNSGDPANGTNAAYTTLSTTTGYIPGFSVYNNGTATLNFGQTAFSHTPPTGFKKINTSNMSTPSIAKPSDNFKPIIYEGNGTGQRVGQFIPFTDDYDITHAALFDSTSSTSYLTKTFSSNPTGGGANGNQKFTLSFWLKMNLNKGIGGAAGQGSALYGSDVDSGSGAVLWQWAWSVAVGPTFNWTDWSNVSGGGSNWLRRVLGNATSTAGPQGGRVQLDYTAWHHYVIAADWSSGGGLAGTDSCAKVYIDGVLQTLFLYDGSSLIKTNPATSNWSNVMANGVANYIGTYNAANASSYQSHYYMAEAIGVDGQQLAASVFGQTDTSSNRWVPKDPTTTLSSASDFGTNGFYLKFEDGTNLGNDSSGNNNDWTMTNMDTTNGSNQMYDTPSRNTATISKGAAASTAELSGGNLTIGGSSGDPLSSPFTIQEVSSGKWYFEGRLDAIDTSTGGPSMGFALSSALSNSTNTAASPANYYTMRIRGGPSIQCNNDGVSWQPSNAPTVAVGTVYGLFIDCDNGKAWGAVDGTIMQNSAGDSVGSPSAGTNPTFLFPNNTAITFFAGGSNAGDITINPGSLRYFDGAATTLDSDAGGYFQSTSIPTGFKALNQDNVPENTAGITGFSWIKNRDAADNHILQDRVRGIYEYIISNDSDDEVIANNTVRRFLQQGVQIGNMDAVNTANESYVLWQWAANGTSNPSVNTNAGFSIATYTGNGSAGNTVTHSLGVIPEFICVKKLGDGDDSTNRHWAVYHVSEGNTKYGLLSDTNAFGTSSGYWNNTTPGTSTFTVGTDDSVNGNNAPYVAYCWTGVEGYSKFGSYTGNNASDGSFVYLGFEPAWLMIKRIDAGYAWHIHNSAMSPYNPVAEGLNANDTGTEAATTFGDFTATGFKLRTTNGGYNGSATYVYAAFSENPFGGSGVAQAKAR
tara:strand:+ start:4113 stop:8081 length:3969 start_codon:yes stop_codon:yes gene_type:complete